MNISLEKQLAQNINVPFVPKLIENEEEARHLHMIRKGNDFIIAVDCVFTAIKLLKNYGQSYFLTHGELKNKEREFGYVVITDYDNIKNFESKLKIK